MGLPGTLQAQEAENGAATSLLARVIRWVTAVADMRTGHDKNFLEGQGVQAKSPALRSEAG